MPSRRHFLTSLAGLTAFTSLTGLRATEALALSLTDEQVPPLPPRSLYDHNQDAFWAALRDQFLIPKDEVYLNNGTVGSSPRPVLKGIFDSFLETEKMDQEDPEQIMKRTKEIWFYKRNTQPLNTKNCGCIFKNPRGLSAGALIDQAGLKGTRLGGAHAL